jgi:hypothetical protein
LKELFHYKNELAPAGTSKMLLISLGDRFAAACVSNSEGDQLYHVCFFKCDAEDTIDLQSFREKSGFMNEKYPQVAINLNYQPDSLMIEPSVTYTLPEQAKTWINSNFPAATLHDQFSINLKINSGDGLYADFKTDELSVVLIKEKKLLFAANLDYETSADLLWHFLSICHHFSITSQEIHIKLSGFIEKDSALYKELSQYFLHLEFDNAEWGATGDLPAHYFRTFNKLARCV